MGAPRGHVVLGYSNEVLKDGNEVEVGEVVHNNFTLSGVKREARGCFSLTIVSTSFARVRRSADMDKSSIKPIFRSESSSLRMGWIDSQNSNEFSRSLCCKPSLDGII